MQTDTQILKENLCSGWKRTFGQCTELDAWGQVVEGTEAYRRFAKELRQYSSKGGGNTKDSVFSPREQAALLKASECLVLRAKSMERMGLPSDENSISLEDVKKLDELVFDNLKDIIVLKEVEEEEKEVNTKAMSREGPQTENAGEQEVQSSLRGTVNSSSDPTVGEVEPSAPVPISSRGEGVAIVRKNSQQKEMEKEKEKVVDDDRKKLSSAAHTAAGATAEKKRSVQKKRSSLGGTLLPVLAGPEGTPLRVHIEKIGLKNATQFVEPIISVTVKDVSGEDLCLAQNTPVCRRKEGSYINFQKNVNLQVPLEKFKHGTCVYFEFQHFKIDKNKLSTKCFSFMDGEDLRAEGNKTLELYEKPLDVKKKKLKLMTSKPLYLHVRVEHNPKDEDSQEE